MQKGNVVTIRKFQDEDRERVREIFFDTAFLGEPASRFFEGKEVFSDALTAYFTDYEPQSCFVAEVDSRVVGCLIGAKDREVLEKISSSKIYPRLIWQALIRGIFLKAKNLRFIWELLVSGARREFYLPVVLTDYPAILHINIDKDYRGFDLGSRLISVFFDYLKSERVKGVSLATMSDGAGKFFEKQGFRLIYTGKRSYFKYLLHKDLPIHIYAKSL